MHKFILQKQLNKNPDIKQPAKKYLIEIPKTKHSPLSELKQ